MAGLVPAIHVLACDQGVVDARDEPAHAGQFASGGFVSRTCFQCVMAGLVPALHALGPASAGAGRAGAGRSPIDREEE
jgi:hypothetical protein